MGDFIMYATVSSEENDALRHHDCASSSD